MNEEIIECTVAILSVIALLEIGIFIGREFGTLEKFVLALLEKAKKRLQ